MNAWPDFVFPNEKGFKSSLLDDYLKAGYYRMQHLLFTTHRTQLSINNEELPVFWLRLLINDIKENKEAVAIRKKCAPFNLTVNNAGITIEVNELYGSYTSVIDFEAAETCSSYLHDAFIENPFDSKMVQIRDENKLIANGYFDVGKNSIAGILNFYDPAYKKYSLGKYLMLKKLDFARSNNMQYYYTGYISTATTKFDYKLFPDVSAIEVFLPIEEIWVPYQTLGKAKLAEYFDKNIR